MFADVAVFQAAISQCERSVFLNVAVFQAASVSDVRQGGKLEKIPSIEHKHAVEWFQRDVETAGRPSITPTQKRLILY